MSRRAETTGEATRPRLQQVLAAGLVQADTGARPPQKGIRKKLEEKRMSPYNNPKSKIERDEEREAAALVEFWATHSDPNDMNAIARRISDFVASEFLPAPSSEVASGVIRYVGLVRLLEISGYIEESLAEEFYEAASLHLSYLDWEEEQGPVGPASTGALFEDLSDIKPRAKFQDATVSGEIAKLLPKIEAYIDDIRNKRWKQAATKTAAHWYAITTVLTLYMTGAGITGGFIETFRKINDFQRNAFSLPAMFKNLIPLPAFWSGWGFVTEIAKLLPGFADSYAVEAMCNERRLNRLWDASMFTVPSVGEFPDLIWYNANKNVQFDSDSFAGAMDRFKGYLYKVARFNNGFMFWTMVVYTCLNTGMRLAEHNVERLEVWLARNPEKEGETWLNELKSVGLLQAFHARGQAYAKEWKSLHKKLGDVLKEKPKAEKGDIADYLYHIPGRRQWSKKVKKAMDDMEATITKFDFLERTLTPQQAQRLNQQRGGGWGGGRPRARARGGAAPRAG